MAKKNVKEVTTKEEVKYEENSCFIPEKLRNVLNVKKRINQTCIYFGIISIIGKDGDKELLELMINEWYEIFIKALMCLTVEKRQYVLNLLNKELKIELVEK